MFKYFPTTAFIFPVLQIFSHKTKHFWGSLAPNKNSDTIFKDVQRNDEWRNIVQRRNGKNFHRPSVTTSNLIQTKLKFLKDTTHTWKSYTIKRKVYLLLKTLTMISYIL